MMHAQLAPEQIEPLPDELNSSAAKLVYLYLDATDGATLEDLNQTLVMKKISILSVLNSLRRDGLVEKCDGHYETLH